MAEPSSLLKNVKSQISDPDRLAKAASSLGKMATAIAKDQEFALEQLPKPEAEDLERLLAGVLETLKTTVRTKPELVLRKAKAAEKRLLDGAQAQLDLPMLWRTHLRAVDTEKGPLIVVEPNGLTPEGFREFAALESIGWRVSLDARFAEKFPGQQSVCALLRPPKKALAKRK